MSISEVSAEFSYQVTYLNRAPVVTSTTLNLPSILEDTPSPLGNRVGTVSQQFAQDADDSDIGITVIQADSPSGRWEYRLTANGWMGFPDTISISMAFHLRSEAWIRFVPSNNFVGTTSLTVLAWDGSNSNNISTGAIPSAFSPSGAYSENSSQLILQVEHVNDPPVVSAAQVNTTYTEDGDPVPIFSSSLNITDSDNAYLQLATVTLTCPACPMEGPGGVAPFSGSGFSLTPSSSDMIVAKFPPHIFQVNTTESDSGTVLLISSQGSNSIAAFEMYLRSLHFTNTQDEPSLANRIVSLFVSDGQNNSNTVEVTIQVLPVNDHEPQISLPYNTIDYIEESGLLHLLPASMTVSDPDETLPLYNMTAFLGNAAAFENLTSNYSGSLSVTELGPAIVFRGPAIIAEYEAALGSLFYKNTDNEPGPATRTLHLIVCDSKFCTSSSLTIQIQPVNDQLPDISILTTALTFTEGNPVSPAIPVASGASITDNDVPFTPITSIIVEIVNPLNTGNEYLQVMGSLDPDVYVNNSNPHRLVIQASGNLQRSKLADTLRMVYYGNDAEEPTGPNRTIHISAVDNLHMMGEQETMPQVVTLLFQLVDDPPKVMLLNDVIMYAEDQPMLRVFLSPNATITDVDDDMLAALTVQFSTGIQNTSSEQLFIDMSLLNGTAIVFKPLNSPSFNLTGNADISSYQAILRSLAYENTDMSGDPEAGPREVAVTGYSAGGLGAGAADIVTIDFSAVNNPPILDLNGNEPGRNHDVFFTEESPQAVALLAPDFLLVDVDSPELAYINITLDPLLDEGDERLIIGNSTASVQVQWHSAAQVVLLGQPSPISEFYSLLSTLAYINNADEPNAQMRHVTFIVSDGDKVSTQVITTANIVLTNDAPLLQLNGTGITNLSIQYTENGPPVFLSPNPELADDDNDTFTLLRIEAIHQEGDMVNASVQLNYSSEVLLVNLNSSGTAAVEAILASLQFFNHLDEPPTGERTYCISVSDGIEFSNRACVTVAFTPVNDNPPVFTEASYTGSVREGMGNKQVNLVGANTLDEFVSDNDTTNSPVVREWSIIAGDDCHTRKGGGEAGENQFFSGDSSTPEMMLTDNPCRFTINGNGAIITTTTPPDRETRAFYNLTVLVSDGIFMATAIVQVTIEDVSDTAPCFIPNNYTATIPQGAQPGHILAQLSVVDPDLNDFVTFLPPIIDLITIA